MWWGRKEIFQLADLKHFKECKTKAQAYAQLTGKSDFRDHAHFIELLEKLNTSQAAFEKVFHQNFKDIIQDPLFDRVSNLANEPFDDGDDTYCIFQIAKEFKLIGELPHDSEYIYASLERLLNRVDTCSHITYHAVDQLFSNKNLHAKLGTAVDMYEMRHNSNRNAHVATIEKILDDHLEKKINLSDIDATRIEKELEKVEHYGCMFDRLNTLLNRNETSR